jgi:hypothetical protein
MEITKAEQYAIEAVVTLLRGKAATGGFVVLDDCGVLVRDAQILFALTDRMRPTFERDAKPFSDEAEG